MMLSLIPDLSYSLKTVLNMLQDETQQWTCLGGGLWGGKACVYDNLFLQSICTLSQFLPSRKGMAWGRVGRPLGRQSMCLGQTFLQKCSHIAPISPAHNGGGMGEALGCQDSVSRTNFIWHTITTKSASIASLDSQFLISYHMVDMKTQMYCLLQITCS